MFTTLSADRIHLPTQHGQSHWASVSLPPDKGFFLIDLDWSETAAMRTQGMLYPATVAAVAVMHTHELAILAMLFIPSSRHDGDGREPVLRVDAIDMALDPAQGYAQVLLVRTLDGLWHACDHRVNLDTLEDRLQMVRLDDEAMPFISRSDARPEQADDLVARLHNASPEMDPV